MLKWAVEGCKDSGVAFCLVCPFGVSLFYIRSPELCCGQEDVEVDSELFSARLQNKFSIWKQREEWLCCGVLETGGFL